MEKIHFMKRYKIVLVGIILWIIPWLIIFLSYPKSFYDSTDQKYVSTVIYTDIFFMVVSLGIILVISFLLNNLKKKNKTNYGKWLAVCLIIYTILVLLLIFLIKFLSGIKDL